MRPSSLSAKGNTLSCCFAIVPDESPAGEAARPLAMFESLEDAMEWGSQRYAGGAFRIRYLQVVTMSDSECSSSAA